MTFMGYIAYFPVKMYNCRPALEPWILLIFCGLFLKTCLFEVAPFRATVSQKGSIVRATMYVLPEKNKKLFKAIITYLYCVSESFESFCYRNVFIIILRSEKSYPLIAS